MLTITHYETVAAYPEQFTEPCRIVRADWPYDCEAKRKHAGDEVYVCEPHALWWHHAPGQAHDFAAVQDAQYSHLYQPGCSCGWSRSGFVKLWLAITLHRQHAGEPTTGEAWCPLWDGTSTGQQVTA